MSTENKSNNGAASEAPLKPAASRIDALRILRTKFCVDNGMADEEGNLNQDYFKPKHVSKDWEDKERLALLKAVEEVGVGAFPKISSLYLPLRVCVA